LSDNNNRSVLIVAGGAGSRMISKTPKQFLILGEKPLLMHTISRFFDFDPELNIILVLPFAHIETWNNLCSQYRFTIPHQVVAGGSERFFSVKNGLAKIAKSGIVAIHDGVRPLVSDKMIQTGFEVAGKFGSAIPVMAPTESLRRAENNISYPVDRNSYFLVQTPQTFKANLIIEAYNQDFQPGFTDDATVFEAAGQSVHLFAGDSENIKITTPADLHIAGYLLAQAEDNSL
jgi:2-C-methyl-D-erythritol 4-phosphate cytidylyltransferase